MRTVEIYFNPYAESTRFLVDGKERKKNDGNRVDEFIVGQSIKKWLTPYVYSYQKWSGLLPELMQELNDDQLKMTFYAPPQYFYELDEEFNKQTSLIEEKGYSADFWVCDCEEFFLPEKVSKIFFQFATTYRRQAPDQYSLSLFSEIANSLNDGKKYSIDDLKKVYGSLKEAVKSAKDYCINNQRVVKRKNLKDANFWENVENDIEKLFYT